MARKTGTPHMVSVNRRFMPYLNQAKSWATKIGPLQYVRATQVRHARDEPDFIWSTAIHVLDALVTWRVKFHFQTEVHRQAGLSTFWYVVSFRFENGARGRMEILPTAGMLEESYDLFGEGFRARVVAGSGVQRRLQGWRAGQVAFETPAPEADRKPRNRAYEEVIKFVRALNTGQRPWPSVEEIVPSARICFAIAESVARQTDDA